jgi:pimeloyl-ACP methyl ester carboxylesterase
MVAQKAKFWCVLVAPLFALQLYAQSVWTDNSPHKTGFVTVNGVRLHYLDWGGVGQALLFLHGSGDTAHIYDLVAPKFTNDFRVLALTRRGHGESEIPDDGYDTATRAKTFGSFSAS